VIQRIHSLSDMNLFNRGHSSSTLWGTTPIELSHSTFKDYDFFSYTFFQGRYWTMSQNSRCWGLRI
jgi:hypothetical protein